jgi:hypothetical protein
MASTEPLRMRVPGRLTPLMRVCAVKGTNSAWMPARSRPRRLYFSLASTTMERPSGFRRRARRVARRRPAARAHVRRGNELGGLAVAQGDGAGLVEQQRVHVAGGLDGASAHGQHVVLHQAVHAGDADGREQAADGGGNQADQQRDQHEDGLRSLGVHGEGLQRDHGQQKDDGQAGEQNAERDLVGRLLARGAFDQGDHAVEEGLAGVGGDADLDPVRENLGAAGDGRAVAAGLADDGADSPVMADSSTEATPSMTSPSPAM